MYAGTLLVKDGSHSSHEDFFQNATVLTEEQKQKTEDFYKFQDQEREYFRKFENKALSAKAGSLFLWDSRCAHQNLLPGKLKLQCCFMKHDASSQMWGMGCTSFCMARRRKCLRRGETTQKQLRLVWKIPVRDAIRISGCASPCA